MNVRGLSGFSEVREVDVDTRALTANLTAIAIMYQGPDGRRLTFYCDENHAQALVLALQAAIAEVQARAVSL